MKSDGITKGMHCLSDETNSGKKAVFLNKKINFYLGIAVHSTVFMGGEGRRKVA